MVISQGEIWWADLPPPVGSEAGFHRPVLVVQNSRMNRSLIKTVVCVPLTSNTDIADAPGNVLLTTRDAFTARFRRERVSDRYGQQDVVHRAGVSCPAETLERIFAGPDILFGR